jgi:hypothetical protein
MRALRVVWDPRSTAGLPSGFTSARGTDVESLGETIPSQCPIHGQRQASPSPDPISWPSRKTASRSRLSGSGADDTGLTPAPRVELPLRTVRLIYFDPRARRYPTLARVRGIDPGWGGPQLLGRKAVLSS